jgi:hypothetical protein
MISRFVFTLSFIAVFCKLNAQDSISKMLLPTKYLDDVSATANHLEQRLDQKTDMVLSNMMKQEGRLKRKLARIDSLKAEQIFGNVEGRYSQLKQRLAAKLPGNKYIPSLDTLSTSLKFLQQNPQSISQIKDGEKKIKYVLGKVNGLEDRFQQAEEIKKYLKERKQQLKDQLGQLGFVKELKKINKKAYYYSEQVKEYSEILKDHKKAERKALELLSKTKPFREFMRKNSMLASLFRLPGDPNDPLAQANLASLQTRAQVNNLIQQQIASGGPNAMSQFRQNMQSAQAQVSQLKDKIVQSGGGSSDDIMPEGFKPNDQRTKGLWKRLEVGTNIQTQKATNFFPVTNDLGLSVGYKLNDRSIIGVGASYKLGMGRGWSHIKFTSEGAGVRSFIDWKLKGSFWISGGYEQNYRTAFNSVDQLRNLSSWQQSGLIGLSKVLDVKSKFFKKTKLQLLWDFLSYEQAPRTQPVVFRIGYNFK